MIYWALGPLVRSFTLLVDPGDICPPHTLIAKFGLLWERIFDYGKRGSFWHLINFTRGIFLFVPKLVSLT
jgi:hypothetical protein